jgi:hypothetical protein
MRRALLLLPILALSACSRPDHYELEPTTVMLEHKGEKRTVRAIAKDRQGGVHPDAKPGSWSSSDEKVVTVDGAGEVSAVGSGTARVTAKRGDLVGEALVEVVLVEKLVVTPLEVKLVIDGDPFKPKVETLDARGKPLQKRLVQTRSMDEKVCHTDRDNQIWPGAIEGSTEVVFKAEGFEQRVKVTVSKK